MTRILLDKNNLEVLVRKFFNENKDFILKQHTQDEKKHIVVFYANGVECRVDLYISNKGIKPVLGKNKDFALHFVEFIESCGIKDELSAHQVSLPYIDILPALIEEISTKYQDTIAITKEGNRYTIKGYNTDQIYITAYDDKFLIQGKPYYSYQMVMGYLADNDLVKFDEFVSINQVFTNITISSNIIREKMRSLLVNSYAYMEEAQLKSISSSFSFIDKKVYSDDYSSALTGVFKGLEGFIKKVLTQEFNCKLSEKQSFSIMGKDKNDKSDFDRRQDIPEKIKNSVSSLYLLYNDTRNVYLHSTVDPKQMRIIENVEEAAELRDKVLRAIENTFNDIFG
jgi:hypothetical protein